MNFFETKEFFKKMFPNKLVTLTFDENCIRQMECIMTEGLPNMMHHVEYRQVKVSVEGMPDQYVSIQPHRETMNWSAYKKMIESKNEVYIHPDQIKELKEMNSTPDRQSEYDNVVKELVIYSGMTREQIQTKMNV